MKSADKSKRTPVDLVITCPHLGPGGAQKVLVALANYWAAQGRRIMVVTLFAKQAVHVLSPEVLLERVVLVKGTGRLAISFRTFYDWLEKYFPLTAGVLKPIRRVFRRAHKAVLMLVRKLHEEAAKRYEQWMVHRMVKVRVKQVQQFLSKSKTPAVLSFCGSTNIITSIAGQKLPLKVVLSERNDPSVQILRFPYQDLREEWYGAADLVTANSAGAIDAMGGYVSEEKLAYVPNPLIDGLAEAPDFELREKTLLVVGRLQPQKGHDVLLHAYASVKDQLSGWRLVFAGEGPEAVPLKALADNLSIGEEIDWLGWVDQPQELCKTAGLFVLPSRFEGMSNALMEAMDAAMPIIVSDASPGMLELIQHEEHGLVFTSEDAEELALALIRMTRNRDLAHRLGAAARKRIQDYALPLIAQQWEQLLEMKPMSPKED